MIRQCSSLVLKRGRRHAFTGDSLWQKQRSAQRRARRARNAVRQVPARKKAAKHATLKKSKAQRAGMSAKKSAARKKRTREAVEARPVAEMPVKTPIIDAIEETAPLAVAVTEYQSVQTAISSFTLGELEEGEGP